MQIVDTVQQNPDNSVKIINFFICHHFVNKFAHHFLLCALLFEALHLCLLSAHIFSCAGTVFIVVLYLCWHCVCILYMFIFVFIFLFELSFYLYLLCICACIVCIVLVLALHFCLQLRRMI